MQLDLNTALSDSGSVYKPTSSGTTQTTKSADSTTTTKDLTSMGKDDFLSLLITQLENQDPLNPMDSTDMVAQLAQFSSLEQMSNLNDQMTSMIQQDTLMQSLSLTGQNVTLTLSDGTEVTGVVEKVIREDGATYIQIGETKYAITDITSMAVVKEETTEETTTEETTTEDTASEDDSGEDGSTDDGETTDTEEVSA